MTQTSLKLTTSPTTSCFDPDKLINKGLAHIDPFDPALSKDIKRQVLEEATKNMVYFFHVLALDRRNTKEVLLKNLKTHGRFCYGLGSSKIDVGDQYSTPVQ